MLTNKINCAEKESFPSILASHEAHLELVYLCWKQCWSNILYCRCYYIFARTVFHCKQPHHSLQDIEHTLACTINTNTDPKIWHLRNKNLYTPSHFRIHLRTCVRSEVTEGRAITFFTNASSKLSIQRATKQTSSGAWLLTESMWCLKIRLFQFTPFFL